MLVRMVIGRFAGEIRDVPSHIARQLIADGRAVPGPPEPETGTIERQTERAVRKRGRPRKVHVAHGA